MSVWVNVTASPDSAFSGIVGTQSDPSDVSYKITYGDGGGSPEIRFNRLKNGVANGLITHTVTLPINGSYQHIVATYDGTNSRLYLNGTLVAGPTAFSGSGTGSTTTRSFILRDVQDVAQDFNGKVDEVGIWDRNLSTAE
ncbi:hypothetical protein LCGC14_3115010, partial [marine sediment metagenome]